MQTPSHMYCLCHPLLCNDPFAPKCLRSTFQCFGERWNLNDRVGWCMWKVLLILNMQKEEFFNSGIYGWNKFVGNLFIEWRRAPLVLYLHLESSIFIQIAPVGWIIFLLNVREIRKKKIQRRLGQQGKIELWNLANYHCGWLLRFANGAN